MSLDTRSGPDQEGVAGPGAESWVRCGVHTENDNGNWVMNDSLRAAGGPPTGKFAIGDAVRVTESLRLRTSASTSAGTIAVMPAGTTGTVVGGPETGSGHTWWQLETSLGTGWAAQDWLVEPDTAPAGTFQAGDPVRVTENLNLRSGPSTGNTVVTVLPAGTTGTVTGGSRTGSGYTWWRIETALGSGWVVESWLVSGAGVAVPATGRLRAGDIVRVSGAVSLRAGPGTDTDVITVLPAGTAGTVLTGPRTASGYPWWRLETALGTGWIAESWLVEGAVETTPPPASRRFWSGDMVRVTDHLNLRSGASTAHGVIAVLPAGTTGMVIGGPRAASGYIWWRLETMFGTGWAAESWLAGV